MENQKKIFRSRISILLIGFMLVAFIPCTVPMIKYMIIPGLYVLGGMLLFVVFILNGIRYIISGNTLYLKFRMIPMGSANIADIISVERTYNSLSSSPAASLKKLCIRFKQGAKYPIWWLTWQSAPNWLLSPVKEKEFVEELKTINPDIYVKISDKKGIWRIWDWDI